MFLFGGGKKQPQQQQQQPQPTQQQLQQQKDLDYERALVQIKKQVAVLTEASEKYETKIEKLDNEIKQLVKQKKKAQAKNKIQEFKGLQKAVQQFETKKNVLIDMQLKLEVANTDVNAANVMKDVNKFLKAQDEVVDQLSDQMLDYQEYLQNQEQTNDIWNQLAQTGTDQNEVNDELEKYEQEVAQEEANLVKAQFDQIPAANVPNIQMQQQQQQQQKQQVPQQKQKNDQQLDLVLESLT